MKPLILIILISINPNWNADSAFVVVKKGRDALVANDYQKAEELFDAGLKLAGVGDSLTIQNAYRYKGILEEYRGEYSYAIKYFNKSLSYARDEDFKFRSNVFNDIGSSYHYLSEYDSAIAYYTTAFELAKKDSMLQERGMILGNMADVYCDQEEYHQALQLLRQNKNHFKYDLHKEI
ncbi:MAG: tetratricopeptide repeat protein, partial [Flavobacteriales bacterium]|nr:tetratricopeptide repeat protein [Flavobacteriales bacterium]